MALRVAVIGTIGVCLFMLLRWGMNTIGALNAVGDAPVMQGLIIVGLIAYACMIAVPFVPGIELGIALLLLKGASIAPFVYGATVAGLFLAYMIGRTVPLTWLHATFRDLRMRRACTLIETIMITPPAERLESARARLPLWLAKLTLDYRYVTIGVLLNLPGTFAIGGGGGILMTAGLTRLFRTSAILWTLVIATLPIPLLVWLSGVDVLSTVFSLK